jgi:hypothetical protein
VSFPPVPGGIFSRSNVPDPTAANQYPVSNSSDKWTLSGVGTIGGNTYNAGWTLSTADLGGEALYSSASGGTATIPLNLTSAVGEDLGDPDPGVDLAEAGEELADRGQPGERVGGRDGAAGGDADTGYPGAAAAAAVVNGPARR